MPTYDYKCLDCSNTWESVRSIKDNTPEKCPVCGNEPAVRVILHCPPTILKGEDWPGKKTKSMSTRRTK